LKYFLFRSTSLTKSTTLLPLTVSALYFFRILYSDNAIDAVIPKTCFVSRNMCYAHMHDMSSCHLVSSSRSYMSLTVGLISFIIYIFDIFYKDKV
jgi:hypothetical protein